MSVVAKLGKYLFLNLLKEWLMKHEIASLDSSICDKHVRLLYDQFLLPGSSIIVINLGDIPIYSKFALWEVDKRNFYVNCVTFSNSYFPSESKIAPFVHATTVTMINCLQTNQALLSNLLSIWDNLLELNLSKSFHITDSSIILVAKNNPRLRVIELSGCSFLTDESIIQIQTNCSLLTWLDISNLTLITDASVVNLMSHCAQLTSLSVAGCVGLTCDGLCRAILPNKNETVTTPAKIITTPPHVFQTDKDHSITSKLTKLNISDMVSMTDSVIHSLCVACPHLTDLAISGCPLLTIASIQSISDHLFKLQRVAFKGLDYSTYLRVRGNNIGNAFSVMGAKFDQITCLDMVNCVMSGTPAAQTIKNNMLLSVVNTEQRYYQNLQDSDVIPLVDRCAQHLQSLVVSECTHTSLLTLISRCEHTLTNLDLSAIADNISDMLMSYVSMYCHNLRAFTLTHNFEVSNKQMCILFKNNIQLTHVNCTSCINMSDLSMSALYRYCPQLVSLNIQNCSTVTAKSILKLTVKCKRLTSLNIISCHGVGESVVDAIRENCKRLYELRIGGPNKLLSSDYCERVREKYVTD